MVYLIYLILGKFNIGPIYLNMFMTAFTIGVVSHIILDMLTVSGVVLFYPLYKKRVRIGIFSSNRYSKMEAKEMVIMIIFIIIAFIAYSDLV